MYRCQNVVTEGFEYIFFYSSQTKQKICSMKYLKLMKKSNYSLEMHYDICVGIECEHKN